MHVLKRFMCGKEGFSTAGSAVALLLSCALVFSGIHIYGVMNESNEVQRVADASAQAAGNEVASFITAVRICDAVLLSMSLTSVTLAGIGIVCCCVPSAQGIATKCIDASRSVIKLEQRTAQHMIDTLNAMHYVLPVSSGGQALAIAAENSRESVHYAAVTELVPATVTPLENPFSETSFDGIEDVAQHSEELQEKSAQAQEAFDRAEQALHEGYMYDCGNAPGYCMYERAASLSDIKDYENPYLHSANTWSFEVALERACIYYDYRAAEEVPGPGDLNEKVKSILRARFYDYMYEQLSNASISTHDGVVVSIEFPRLPVTKEDVMHTDMYTDNVYPVSAGIEELPLIHAWSGCPYCENPYEKASLKDLDDGVYDVCPGCMLTTAQLARVAAATSVIDSGFEYHYKKVAQAAEVYSQAMAQAQPLAEDIKKDVSTDFDLLKQTAQVLSACRLEAYPAGNCGAVVSVIADCESREDVSAFAQGLSHHQQAAISAVTIVDNPDVSVIEGVFETVGSAIGVDGIDSGLGFVGGIWSWALDIYGNGVEGSCDAVKEICDALPLVSSSGLGKWAQEALMDMLDSMGLQPANTSQPTVMVVNSLHVARHGDAAMTQVIRRMKDVAEAQPRWPDDG